MAEEMNIITFPVIVRDISLLCQIIPLSGSCYIWIGSSTAPSMGSMIVSMPTRFDDSMPLSSTLITGEEGSSDDFGSSMAQRVAKRFHIQCFVSCNLPAEVVEDVIEIQQPIFERLAVIFPKKL